MEPRAIAEGLKGLGSLAFALLLFGFGCSSDRGNDDLTNIGILTLLRVPAQSKDDRILAMSYDQFRSQAFREAVDDRFTGTYIVNGDSPAGSEEELHQFYNDYASSYERAHPDGRPGLHALTVYNIGSVDIVWSPAQKMNISYCVSSAFGVRQASVIQAMAGAAGAWEGAGNVHFVYNAAQNDMCTSANGNVVFNVSPISGQQYLARAFFPNTSRANRSIMIDSQSFWVSPPYTLVGILRHELGHTLGLRHEQTRPEAGVCFEDNAWRAVTPFDSASVMQYPQCNGTSDGAFTLTRLDIQGIGELYGAGTLPHVSVSGIHALDVVAVVAGSGFVDVTNNGARVTATQTGSGTISITNNGQLLTATNMGGGLLRITSTSSAPVTVSNTGNGNFTLTTSGATALTFEHTGDDDATYLW